MIFVYIIFSAILLYYALKLGIRDGLIEIETNKDDLIYYKKVKIYLMKLRMFIHKSLRLNLKMQTVSIIILLISYIQRKNKDYI